MIGTVMPLPTTSLIISSIIFSSEERFSSESLDSITIWLPSVKDMPSSSEFSSSEFSSLLLFSGIISPITDSNVSVFRVSESSTLQNGIMKYATIERTQRTEMIKLQIAIFFFKGFFDIVIIPPHTRARVSLFYHVIIILSLCQQKVNGFCIIGK